MFWTDLTKNAYTPIKIKWFSLYSNQNKNICLNLMRCLFTFGIPSNCNEMWLRYHCFNHIFYPVLQSIISIDSVLYQHKLSYYSNAHCFIKIVAKVSYVLCSKNKAKISWKLFDVVFDKPNLLHWCVENHISAPHKGMCTMYFLQFLLGMSIQDTVHKKSKRERRSSA